MAELPPVFIVHSANAADAELAAIFARLLNQRNEALVVHRCAFSFPGQEPASAAVSAWLQERNWPEGAVLVGLRLGGLVAAKLQELRPDLHVLAINAPVAVSGLELSGSSPRRFAFCREAAAGKQSVSWPQLAQRAYSGLWVNNRATLAQVIAAYLEGGDIDMEVRRATARLQGGSTPAGPIRALYLLHGKSGLPTGSVARLEEVLAQHWPGLDYCRPLLPHHDPQAPAERSVEYLRGLPIPSRTLVVGLSLGGLVAAKFQEERPDLQVFAVNSPTWDGAVRLQRRMEHRIAIYSSQDEVIAGRTAAWPELAEAYDFAWLTHETTPHIKYLVRLIDWYLEGRLALTADRVRFVQRTRPEREAEIWKSLQEGHRDGAGAAGPGSEAFPGDYRQIGEQVASGRALPLVWKGFLRGFYRRPQSSCLASEPPESLAKEDRAWLAGVAEFLSHKCGLKVPGWTQNRKYFLEREYDRHDSPEKEVGGQASTDWIRRARTPKELLRHGVIAKASSLLP